MTLIHETLVTGVFVSFYVYDPKGVLLHTEQNEMFIDSYNKETKTGLRQDYFVHYFLLRLFFQQMKRLIFWPMVPFLFYCNPYIMEHLYLVCAHCLLEVYLANYPIN